MRKVLALGLIGAGFVAGCMSAEDAQYMAANMRASELNDIKWTCHNDYGFDYDTTEYKQCIQTLDQQLQAQKAENLRNLGKIYTPPPAPVYVPQAPVVIGSTTCWGTVCY